MDFSLAGLAHQDEESMHSNSATSRSSGKDVTLHSNIAGLVLSTLSLTAHIEGNTYDEIVRVRRDCAK